jgi:hypothetical protein
MTTSWFAGFGVLILAVLAVVFGMTPLLFVPVFLVAGVLLAIPIWAAMSHRSTFRRDTGAPSTPDASYDPVQRR